MELFDYIAIAFSFVYTTAAIRLIGGLSAAINKDRRYIVHLLFIVIMIVSIITSFWGIWAHRYLEDWKLYKFIFLLIDGALYYFIATVLVPENPNEIDSWKNHYYKNKNKLFYAMLTFLVYIQLNGFVLTGEFHFAPEQFFHLIFIIPIFFGLWSKNHKVHLAIACFNIITTFIMMLTVASEPGWVSH